MRFLGCEDEEEEAMLSLEEVPDPVASNEGFCTKARRDACLAAFLFLL